MYIFVKNAGIMRIYGPQYNICGSSSIYVGIVATMHIQEMESHVLVLQPSDNLVYPYSCYYMDTRNNELKKDLPFKCINIQ